MNATVDVGGILYVPDAWNNRVLGFIGLPTEDGAAADVVAAQASMTTSVAGSGQTGMGTAFSVASNGNQILIPDYDNARVLVFNAFPTANGTAGA